MRNVPGGAVAEQCIGMFVMLPRLPNQESRRAMGVARHWNTDSWCSFCNVHTIEISPARVPAGRWLWEKYCGVVIRR